MCVGIAGKVVKLQEGTALVDVNGAKREVSAELLNELEPGDYVMVHAGAAIARITGDEEQEAENLLEELLI